jgi:DNA-binding CsgD family transcriptional regulator
VTPAGISKRSLPPTPDSEQRWPTQGQPLEDDDLRARIAAVTEPVGAGGPFAFADAEHALDRAFERISEALQTPECGRAALQRHAASLRAVALLQRELSQADLAHRTRAFARVQEALARMRSVTSVSRMIDLIPAEICRCGFSRAILSRVELSDWVPESVHVNGDADWAAEILRVGREQRRRLDHLLLETEMVRRRAPMLVQDAQREPHVHRPLADVTATHSYVAAPLMPEGRVIGFLHADDYLYPREVDEFDRDLLWMLAEGFGYAYERTALIERQRSLRARVMEMTASIGQVVGEVDGSEVEIARIERDTANAVRSAAAPLIAPESRLYTVLTRREIEIAQLMAEGNTNARIARELVIAEGTVKTHVSQILRKLRASNRAEAVSKYTKLAAAGDALRGP